MGVAVVGRKKKSDMDRNRKSVVITIKGDQAWREWVEAGARRIRMPVSVAIDLALAQFFKEHGYEVPPPDRLPNGSDEVPNVGPLSS